MRSSEHPPRGPHAGALLLKYPEISSVKQTSGLIQAARSSLFSSVVCVMFRIHKAANLKVKPCFFCARSPGAVCKPGAEEDEGEEADVVPPGVGAFPRIHRLG